jgi:predicted RNA-binding Zn-ribbon protein involved in translation (DUF1610 family)
MLFSGIAVINANIRRRQRPTCEFKTKAYSYLKVHKKIHLSPDAVKWYSCNKCEYKTKYRGNIKEHNITNHLSTDASQWYSCDECEFKSRRKYHLKRHKTVVHPSADAVQWYSCDKCEFKTKRNAHLKRHKRLVCRKPRELPKTSLNKASNKNCS